MKKVFLVLIVVSMILCACTTAGQKTPQNVGKPIENESVPSGSIPDSTGALTTESTGAPATQGSQPATSAPATSAPATSAPATNPPATTPPATTPPATTAPHTHQYAAKVTKVATCSEAGVKTYTCGCGASYTETIPTISHNWGNWITVKLENVAETGERKHTCNDCGTTQSEIVPKVSYEGINYFYNPQNSSYTEGSVTLRPRCVYWRDGKLYAEIFMINGTSNTVTVNGVSYLKIVSGNLQLAEAYNFSNSGGTISSKYNRILHLVFSSEEINHYGTSLQDLILYWKLDP